MGKNQTVQKTRVKILKYRMEEIVPVDYDEESGLENDSDSYKVHKSSHIDPSKSNSPNSSNSKLSNNFENGKGENGEKDVSRSEKGSKKPQNSSRNNQSNPISPKFSKVDDFPGGQPKESDIDERETGGKNSQVLPQADSYSLKSQTKSGSAPIGKKGRPNLNSDLSENVESAKAHKKAQASIAIPQSGYHNSQEETEYLQTSDSDEDRKLAHVAYDDPGRISKRKFSEGNELGNKAEDDKDTVHTSPNEPLSSRKSRKKGSAEDDKDIVHVSPNAPQLHLESHSHGYGHRAGLKTPNRGGNSIVGPSNLFIPESWMRNNPGHGPVRKASKGDIFPTDARIPRMDE